MADHFQVWWRDEVATSGRWTPSETCPRREWAIKRADDLQRQFPFADIEISAGAFAEIDTEEFEVARRDPNTKRLADFADKHLETLRREGRIV